VSAAPVPTSFEIRYSDAEIADASRALARHWLRTWLSWRLVTAWIVNVIGVACTVAFGMRGIVLYILIGLAVVFAIYWPLNYALRLHLNPRYLRRGFQPSARLYFDALEFRMTANGHTAKFPWSRFREIREVPGFFLLGLGLGNAIPLPRDQVPPTAQALLRSARVTPLVRSWFAPWGE